MTHIQLDAADTPEQTQSSVPPRPRPRDQAELSRCPESRRAAPPVYRRYGGVIALALLCTGCMNWDSTEINQLGIVGTSGIQLLRPNDPHSPCLASMQVARPNKLEGGPGGAEAGGADTFIVAVASGSTAASAVASIQRQLPRRFFLRDRRVTVIGEDYARLGISDLLDEMVRNPESRLRAYLLMSHGVTPLQILKLPSALDRLPANGLVELERSGQAVSMNVVSFVKALTGRGDPYMEGVTVLPKSKLFVLRGVAVFRHDRFVGWLNNIQSRGFYWIQKGAGETKVSGITVRLPHGKGFVTAQLTRVESNILPVWKGAQPSFHIQMKVRYDLVENLSPLVVDRPDDGHQLEAALASTIRSQIRSTVDVLQHQYHADIVGFADRLFETFPDKWRRIEPNWRQVYSSMPISIDVRVRLAHGGLINGSISQDGGA